MQNEESGSTASNATLWVLLLTLGAGREMFTATTQMCTPKILVWQVVQHWAHT
jgi:hypothetical protein